MFIYSQNYLNSLFNSKEFHVDIFYPLRRWIDGIEVTNITIANLISNLIPSSCPFERDVTILGKTFHIPPLCKFNPLYEEFMSLRFRALLYLEEN